MVAGFILPFSLRLLSLSFVPPSGLLRSASSYTRSLPTRGSSTRSRTTRTAAFFSSTIMTQAEWEPLDPESLVAAPCLIEQTLCQPSDDGTQAQLAKDLDYAKAVLEAWKEDEDISWQAVWKPVTYHDDKSGSNLYGYCIRRSVDLSDDKKVPGMLFFHTGAGPHDLFLLYKAVSLVNSLDDDVVVFIADMIGDESGWAWSPDRSKFNAARDQVLAVDDSSSSSDDGGGSGPCRPVLQGRIQAALDYLAQHESVDRFAAFGWCFGGHSVLELSRMASVRPPLKAMATFHGVFDGLPAPDEDKLASSGSDSSETVDVLICHGTNDPFVSNETLEAALATLQAQRFRTSLLQLSAKHGFTNPAQDFNDNPAFAYDSAAAEKAWRQAVNLVREKLK